MLTACLPPRGLCERRLSSFFTSRISEKPCNLVDNVKAAKTWTPRIWLLSICTQIGHLNEPLKYIHSSLAKKHPRRQIEGRIPSAFNIPLFISMFQVSLWKVHINPKPGPPCFIRLFFWYFSLIPLNSLRRDGFSQNNH